MINGGWAAPLRLTGVLLATAALAAAVMVPLADRLLVDWSRRDVDLRASVIAASIDDTVSRLLLTGGREELTTLLDRVAEDERVIALIVCDSKGKVLSHSTSMPDWLDCGPNARLVKLAPPRANAESLVLADFPISAELAGGHQLRVVHDLRFADARRATMRNSLIGFSAGTILLLGLIFGLGMTWSARRWSNTLLRDIRHATGLTHAPQNADAQPFLDQVRKLLREVEASQRLEIEYQENFTPKALQHIVQQALGNPELILVSNREPYIHDNNDAGGVTVRFPASGMVSALEPVIRACSGTWVAHGSGSADRSVVDGANHIRVPPHAPSYTLRRVWLSADEEQGYYYGFSNEGLWPLCHLVYVRPEFRLADWLQFQAVNQKFAQAVVQESRTDRPVVLLQDFHLALAPQLIRQALPSASLVLFWHIPWPNAEAFGICPWKKELLEGLLAADILGFHTRAHCLNFLSTVDRYLETQIDHEHLSVSYRGHTCRIGAYPISVEWPPTWQTMSIPVATCREKVRARHQISDASTLAISVERWDFTKGILERLAAFELLFERRPDLIGKLTLLQIAAPSRSTLETYRVLQERTLAECERINQRFGNVRWKPIRLVTEHHEPEQVCEIYRSADICLVGSLHDGMNLVAKEFVAARDDEDGVLILSTFAGASRELPEALLFNPFDIAEAAAILERALTMDRAERRMRMGLMRQTLRTNNVYRWAGRMLVDVANVRQRQNLRRLAKQNEA